MQLEAGKKYVDRRGRVYGPLEKAYGKFFGENKETSLWGSDGTICGLILDMDLVAEYVEPAPVNPVVDPGDGYRLLGLDEVTLPDDERIYAEILGGWNSLDSCNAKFVGVTVGSLLTKWPMIVIRRKLPPKTRTVVLKEWMCWDLRDPSCVRMEWCTTNPALNLGDTIEYDYAHPTGNERTIEIPVT